MHWAAKDHYKRYYLSGIYCSKRAKIWDVWRGKGYKIAKGLWWGTIKTPHNYFSTSTLTWASANSAFADFFIDLLPLSTASPRVFIPISLISLSIIKNLRTFYHDSFPSTGRGIENELSYPVRSYLEGKRIILSGNLINNAAFVVGGTAIGGYLD